MTYQVAGAVAFGSGWLSLGIRGLPEFVVYGVGNIFAYWCYAVIRGRVRGRCVYYSLSWLK